MTRCFGALIATALLANSGASPDVTPPNLEIAAPGAVVAGDTTPEIRLLFADSESGIAPGSLVVRVDGGELGAGCSVSSGSATCKPRVLAEGAHRIDAEVRNRAGLRAVARLDFILLASPDTTPPTLIIESPADGATVDTTKPEIRLRYVDDRTAMDPATLQVAIDGAALRAEVCNAGADLALCQAPPLLVGPHTLTASVRDLAGNSGTATSTFTIPPSLADTTPPELKIAEPISGPIYEDPEFEIFALYSDSESGIDPASVRASVDGADLTAGCFVVPGFSLSCRKPLTLGTHRGEVRVRDRAGNESVASFQVEVLPVSADTVLPIVEIDLFDSASAVAGGIFKSRRLEASISFSDAESGIEGHSREMSLDGVDIKDSCRGLTATTADCLMEDLANGSHTLTVQIADRAGNVGQASVVFSVQAPQAPADTKSPWIEVHSPPQLALQDPNLRLFAVWGDDSSAVDLSTLHVQLDRQSLPFGCIDSWELNCDAPPLAAGIHNLTIQVADLAGNPASLSYAFEVIDPTGDTKPPTIGFGSPAEGEVVVGDPSPEFVVSYADQERGSGIDRRSFRLILDGVDLTPFCSTSAEEARCTPPEFADGLHIAVATVADRMGNTASATRSFTIQRKGPDNFNPRFSFLAPVGPVVRGVLQPQIVLEFADDDPGLDLGSL